MNLITSNAPLNALIRSFLHLQLIIVKWISFFKHCLDNVTTKFDFRQISVESIQNIIN